MKIEIIAFICKKKKHITRIKIRPIYVFANYIENNKRGFCIPILLLLFLYITVGE